MRLDEYIEDLERDAEAKRRQLAKERSYEVVDYLDDIQRELKETLSGNTLFGSTSPSIFVGRHNYPNINTGVLSPVGNETRAQEFVTDSQWYESGFSIEDVFERRSGLLNSNRSTRVHVEDVWDGFVGTQREVAIADRPVDVEIGLDDRYDLDLDLEPDQITSPNGPRARAESAHLAENPHVPRPVKKTLEDDEWQAEGAMTYLYRRDFDVYEINNILSAGALGRGQNRRLVPTRWSITAVDDTVGQYLRGQIRNAPSINQVEVWENEYIGNRYWVILVPGKWEYELVEMKSPGSIWNPDPSGEIWIGSDYEPYEGRTAYVDETAGAYYAARLGVLEELANRNRQAKALVLREVSDEYWAPVGVWQIRESVRNAFDGPYGSAETLGKALSVVSDQLPISMTQLRRSSELAAGVQMELSSFG